MHVEKSGGGVGGNQPLFSSFSGDQVMSGETRQAGHRKL